MPVQATGFGVRVTIFATTTLPLGYSVTQGDKGSNFIDVPAIEIGGAEMGVNGDLVVYNTANRIDLTINVIADSQDDTMLSILGEANRPARGKRPTNDIITAVLTYPGGKVFTLIGGVILSFMPANGVADTGKLNTKEFKFAFENRIVAS